MSEIEAPVIDFDWLVSRSVQGWRHTEPDCGRTEERLYGFQ